MCTINRISYMRNLISIQISEDGNPIVTSDFMQVNVRLLQPIESAFMKRPKAKDYKSVHPAVLSGLLAWRKEKAREMNVAPFIILSNRTLFEIADNAPLTDESLLTVNGFGESKFDKFGLEILQIVEESLAQEVTYNEEAVLPQTVNPGTAD